MQLLDAVKGGFLKNLYGWIYNYNKVLDCFNKEDKIAIYGPKGVGKSCCLLAMWVSLMKQMVPCIYTSVTAM